MVASPLRNVLALGGGSFIAQLLNLITIPIITRLFDPAAFGQFATSLSLIMVFCPLVTLQYHVAIVVPAKQRVARDLYFISCVSAFSIIPLILTVLYLLSQYTNMLTFTPMMLALLGSVLLLQSFYIIVNFVCIREKRFKDVALSRIMEVLFDRIFTIFMATKGLADAAVLLAGKLLGVLIAWFYCNKKNSGAGWGIKDILCEKSRKELLTTALNYSRFPAFNVPSAFLNRAFVESPVILLAIWFPAPVVAAYALSIRIVNAPMQMVGDAISKVFFQLSSEKVANGDCLKSEFEALLSYGGLIVISTSVVLIGLGPSIAVHLFGTGWEMVGVVLVIMAVPYMFGFLYRPISVLFDVFGRQKARLYFDIAQFVTRLVVLVYGGFFGQSILITLLVMSIFTSVLYLFAIIYIAKFVEVTVGYIFFEFFKRFAQLIPLVAGCTLVNFSLVVDAYEIIALATAVLIIQVAVLLSADSNIKKLLKINLKRHPL